MKKTVLQIMIVFSTLSGFSQNYSNGLFLVNEGNFGTPDGDISFYDSETDSLYSTVFQNANPGEDGFDILQDFEMYNSEAYFLTKSASNEKLVITNTSDFIVGNTIDLNGSGPQSITFVSDEKAYISCANAPNLRILDLEGDSIRGEVSSSVGSFYSQDYISVDGDKAYIFMGSSVGVIDIELDSAYTSILTPNAQSSCAGMMIANDKLFVLTNAGWSGDSSHLFRIDLETNSVELSLDLSSLGKARLLQSDGDNLYFMVVGDVYKMGLDEDLAPTTPFASSSYIDVWGDLAYGQSFLVDATTETIYIGSAEEYVGNSTYESIDLNDGSSLSTENPSGGPILNKFIAVSGTLGIRKIENLTFRVYPNPASSFVLIESEGSDEKKISLYTLNGKEVLAIKTNVSKYRMDLGDLPSGVFFIKVESKYGSATKKILIK